MNKIHRILISCASLVLIASQANAAPINLFFNHEDVFTQNFYSSPTVSGQYTISSSGAVIADASSSSTLRVTTYSPGEGSAPTDYKQALDIFYNGTVAMTFRSNQNAGASENTIGIVSRIQENGQGIAALATIYGGSVRFQFMAIDTQTGQNIAGTTFGQQQPAWSGSTLAPANTPLIAKLEVEDLMFKFSLLNPELTELVTSGWQELPESLWSEYNQTGGVGIRTYSRPRLTITQFDIDGSPIPEPAHAAVLTILVLGLTVAYRRTRRHR